MGRPIPSDGDWPPGWVNAGELLCGLEVSDLSPRSLASWVLVNTAGSLPGGWPFIFKPSNPESTPPQPPLLGRQILGHHSPPSPQSQVPGAWRQLLPARTPEITPPANRKRAHPASPIPSCGNHTKGSCPCSAPLPSASCLSRVLPRVVPRCGEPLLLGPVTWTSCLFNGSHLLTCQPAHTK